MNKGEWQLIDKIVARGEKMGLFNPGETARYIPMMDIDLAHKHFNLDLQGLLEAEPCDFVHDFQGIRANVNRSNLTFENYFLPRYAKGFENKERR